jgi:hypothetical protein
VPGIGQGVERGGSERRRTSKNNPHGE